jgi:hypothetical protein
MAKRATALCFGLRLPPPALAAACRRFLQHLVVLVDVCNILDASSAHTTYITPNMVQVLLVPWAAVICLRPVSSLLDADPDLTALHCTVYCCRW